MGFEDVISKITADHVNQAMTDVEKYGVPPNRRSTKWCLQAGNRRYPPKYVLAVAAKIATGQALPPNAHGGGKQTNQILRKLGFTIIPCADGGNAPEK